MDNDQEYIAPLRSYRPQADNPPMRGRYYAPYTPYYGVIYPRYNPDADNPPQDGFDRPMFNQPMFRN